MAFLSGLFKKKSGGTFFGNLVRSVWNSTTVGHIFPLKPAKGSSEPEQ